MRVAVRVEKSGEEAWQVDIDIDGVAWTHRMRREKQGTSVLCWPADPGDLDLGRTFDALDRIADRSPEAEDMAAVGEALRRALLGSCWPSLTLAVAARPASELLELALEWPANAGDLTALPWELLHDDDGFLLLRHPHPVTITRVVLGAHAEPMPVYGTPRVLFAIGVDLSDSQIRPGAELMGLLGETSEDVPGLYPLVLEHVSLPELQLAAARFKPDVVHLICHGDIEDPADGGHGYLLLKDPENEKAPKRVYGDQLAAAVCDGERRPLMVLSACKGAAAGGPGSFALAASLVHHGAPAAIAMSGTVRDQACRLFARSFVKALVAGLPLGEAMAHGRCAAFFEGGSAAMSPDWAYPTVFCSSKVRTTTTFAQPGVGGHAQRIRALGFTGRPLFCGRGEFMTQYRRLVDPDTDLSTLVIEAARKPGLGENRLLKEFGAAAVRDGHLPLHVAGPANGQQPKASFFQVALAILRAALLLGEKLGFTLSQSVVLALLDPAATAAAQADHALRRVLYSQLIDAHFASPPAGLGPGTVRQALSIDLAQLLADARELGLAGDTSRVVVLLAGVDQWDLATGELADVVDQFGLGGDRLAPVVMTWVQGQQEVALAKLRGEQYGDRTYLKVMELKPFRQEEALLASEWVLMHARPQQASQRDYLPCVITDTSGKIQRVLWDKLEGGYPGRMLSEAFTTCAQFAVIYHDAVLIDDEERLSRYLAQLRAAP